jgi:hypothetical protein
VDISDTLAPKSDQLDAVDLLSGPRTFTIERVSKGNAEQPVNLHLAEFPRPWRPGLSMRRVLVSIWGKDASAYVGRKVRLYCDPDVEYGGQAVGGTRIEALSHIDGPKKVPLLIKRGRSAMFTVQPLRDEPPSNGITADQLKELAAALRDNQLTERAAVLAYVSDVVGRDVDSSKSLTRDEAAKVIESLRAAPADEGDELTLDGAR